LTAADICAEEKIQPLKDHPRMRTATVHPPLVHLLHRASQIAEAHYGKGGLKISARQARVLEVIAAHPGSSQTDICERTGIDRSTLADIVRRLAQAGLVSRKHAEKDARAYQVKILPKGETELAKAAKVIEKADALLIEAIPATYRKVISGILAALPEPERKAA
jgi:DNA-binding MarR family transcriptional regulator